MDSHKAETIEASYLIPGWMWPKELGWLYRTFGSSSAHLEVGCFCGKSLFVTACAMGRDKIPNPPLCIAVDSLDYSALGRAWETAVLKATLEEIQRRSRVNVQWWPMTSISAMQQAREQCLRFDSIFIDGDHRRAETTADIGGWLPFLRPGGIIAGHDYGPRYPGVMDAVNEIFPDGIEVVPDSRIWWKRIET